jgi:8-oxo-dGTP pyrophosphatase MutT (NUDIX family)
MIEKVTAFIVRKKNEKPELLVFSHPRAGIQIPAGTVEENESLETALFREIKEETGLIQLKLVRKLGETLQFTTQNEAFLTQTLRCYSWPAQAAKRNGPLCTRGLLMQTQERKVGFTHVKYTEYDFNKEPPVLISELEGWLPSEVLTREFQRHFYLLKAKEETADNWKIESDRGNVFQFYWANMNAFPALMGEQAEWLKQLEGVALEEI